MVTSAAIVHGDRDRLLRFDASEQPLALQVGGSDPNELARAARIGSDYGYSEINLNVGCPSDRVQSGRFGACLMQEPELVAECVSAMRAAVDCPVTVKCRLGVDDQDPQESLFQFVEKVRGAGCDVFIIHARKAWLKGLSPKENRDVPPLDYSLVHRLKHECPDLTIVLNGGLSDVEASIDHLNQVDGVMVGRAAYQRPFCLAQVDHLFFNDAEGQKTRPQIIEDFLPYVEREYAAGTPLTAMTRHILGLFQGQPGARAWRRHLSENAPRAGATSEVIREALTFVADSSQLTAA